jgi:hypothetical protein
MVVMMYRAKMKQEGVKVVSMLVIGAEENGGVDCVVTEGSL